MNKPVLIAGICLLGIMVAWLADGLANGRERAAEKAYADEIAVRRIYENIRLASVEAGKKWQKDGVSYRRNASRNCLIYHTGKGDWSDEELDSFTAYHDRVSHENEKRMHTENIIAGWMKSQED